MLATIELTNSPVPTLPMLPPPSGAVNPQRFGGLASATPVTRRTLVCRKIPAILPVRQPSLFPSRAVEGQTPALLNALNRRAIMTHQGAVQLDH